MANAHGRLDRRFVVKHGPSGVGVICLATTDGSCAGPDVHDVPFHRQITEYSCGAACLQMVLRKWGVRDVDQRHIVDVVRTHHTDGACTCGGGDD